jgi:hypothetical protein
VTTSAQSGPVAPPDPTAVVPPGWQDAAADLRTTVKWMVTAFAAVGGVMFAKGFVSTPKLDWSHHEGRLLLAWAVGAIGLGGIGWLIFQAVNKLKPTLYELGTLPTGYKRMVDAEPRFYLPSDCDSVEDFLHNLQALRKAEAAAGVVVTKAQAAAQTASNPLTVQALAVAKRQHDALVAGLATYVTTRQELLDRASYWDQARGMTVDTVTMVVAAVVAAAGGIGYQLLLSTPDATPSPASAGPALGTMSESSTDAGAQLWTQLGLARCQSKPAVAEIPVLVASGTGTQSDPYVVSTLPTGKCPATTFSVVSDVAQVSVPSPSPVTITYTPAPSATPTSADPSIPGPSL